MKSQFLRYLAAFAAATTPLCGATLARAPGLTSEKALQRAAAARCAAEQGQSWELRHQMIINGSQLQPDKIVGYAQNASMDVDKFKTCVASDKYRAAIDKDVAEGTAAGVSGTPSFV